MEKKQEVIIPAPPLRGDGKASGDIDRKAGTGPARPAQRVNFPLRMVMRAFLPALTFWPGISNVQNE